MRRCRGFFAAQEKCASRQDRAASAAAFPARFWRNAAGNGIFYGITDESGRRLHTFGRLHFIGDSL